MENKEKYVGINFTDGLTDVNNLSVNDASVIKNSNITDGKIIHQ